jgi:hypothetical protein
MSMVRGPASRPSREKSKNARAQMPAMRLMKASSRGGGRAGAFPPPGRPRCPLDARLEPGMAGVRAQAFSLCVHCNHFGSDDNLGKSGHGRFTKPQAGSKTDHGPEAAPRRAGRTDMPERLLHAAPGNTPPCSCGPRGPAPVLLARMLRRRFAVVLEAGNGVEALAMYGRHRPDMWRPRSGCPASMGPVWP